MLISEFIKLAKEKDVSVLDSELILANILNKSREQIFSDYDKNIGELEGKALDFLNKREEGISLAYILGKKEFFGLEFNVSLDCLVPRPETEILVEKGLEYIEKLRITNYELRNLNLLDIGTGSGCIAVSVAKNCPFVEVTASDISDKALKIAKKNADKFNLSINFVQSDLLNNFQNQCFYIITANLPYVPNEGFVDKSCNFEPKNALFGGETGLEIYERLFQQMNDFNIIPRVLFMEIGVAQDQEMRTLLKKHFADFKVSIYNDLVGIPRVIRVEFENSKFQVPNTKFQNAR